MALSRGTTLVLVGIGLFVAMVAVGAATAPDRTVAGADPVATPTPAPAGGETPAPGDTATATDPATDPSGTATETPARPLTLVGVQGGWVKRGDVRMFSGTDEVWRETAADGYFEVSMLADGTVLAAFANESSDECGDLGPDCARTGFRHIDPDAPGGPRVVEEYSFPVGSLTNSEVHAVDHLGGDRYVFTDMEHERVAVVEDDTEVWQWNASSFYEAPPDPTSRDWLHINDVDAIGEGRFLVSVRNANQIVVVERGQGVVEVINEDGDSTDENCLDDGRLYDGDGDGDVRCGDPDVMKEQHNPQWLGPGRVLVADSQNHRVVELHKEGGDWEVAWVLREAGGIELTWPRDADRLPNGNTLVTDSRNQRVFEVDPDKTLVWSASTGGDIPYEADRLPYGEISGAYGSEPGPGDGATPTDTPDGTATDTTPGATPTTTDGYSLPTVTGSGETAGDETGSEVPVLSLVVAAMRGTFSWLPFWFAEPHLAVTVLSVGLVVAGGVDHWRNPSKRVALPGLA
jgi:hypothetical protein